MGREADSSAIVCRLVSTADARPARERARGFAVKRHTIALFRRKRLSPSVQAKKMPPQARRCSVALQFPCQRIQRVIREVEVRDRSSVEFDDHTGALCLEHERRTVVDGYLRMSH